MASLYQIAKKVYLKTKFRRIPAFLSLIQAYENLLARQPSYKFINWNFS